MAQVDRQPGLLRQVEAGAVHLTTLTGVVLAALLGVFLILGTGLAGPNVLHNAAHDARHGIAFPCH